MPLELIAILLLLALVFVPLAIHDACRALRWHRNRRTYKLRERRKQVLRARRMRRD